MKDESPRALALFLIIAVLFVTAFPSSAAAQQAAGAAAAANGSPYAAALQKIEAKLDARRKELGIPGVAMAIVKDDEVIYLKGLGYKDLENRRAVTPDTQFAIGSATKAFTALTVLMAEDAGLLSLDDPPKKYLPYFRMYDPEADKAITLRDLLSHSSGLNRTDLAMITGKFSRAELIEVAAQAKPTAKLREKFQYQNIMFVAAGEAAAAVEKRPWERLVAERILDPLGMTNSTVSIAAMQKARDHSFGYSYNFDTKETKRLPFRSIDQVAPAGSINSSARDMAAWLRFVLNGGVAPSGKRLVSERGFEEWTKPQMKIAGKTSYGLGWFIQEWNGFKVLQHGGSIDGFNSMVAMLPEKKLGFVLLTNVSSSPLGGELMPIVWQNLLGEAAGPEATQPVESEKEAGRYRFEAAGFDIEIKMQDGKLQMIVPGHPVYTLEPVGPRRYKLGGAPDGFFITFKEKEAYLEQPHGNYTLPRFQAEAEVEKRSASSAAKELVGQYSLPSGAATIEVKESSDGSVTLNVPGQPAYRLIEKAKDQFSLSPLPDSYSLRVKRDAAGKITGIAISQPEGEFEFKRVGDAAPAGPAITVDELMQRSIDAIGGEANWRKITTRVVEADVDLENQGVKAKVVAYSKAPNKSAAETIMTALNKQIATGWEYFDGTAGEEVYSFAPAERFAGKRLEDARLAADFYAPLNWKTNYKKVEITGTAKVGDEEAYVVSFESEKGTPFKEYYSTKTFLLLKREGVVPSSTSPQQIPYSVTYSDYRDVDGIKLPFRTVNNSISNGNIVQIVRSVKHNMPVDDKIFRPRKLR
ncbi:MAG: serine hydrolase [Pyrinomonadaceae bacterium]